MVVPLHQLKIEYRRDADPALLCLVIQLVGHPVFYEFLHKGMYHILIFCTAGLLRKNLQ